MSDSALSDRGNARHLPDKGIDMKKLTRKVSFRVTEEMGDWMDDVGADVVRQAMLEKMHPMSDIRADERLREVMVDPEQPTAVQVAVPKAKMSDKAVVGAEPVWKVKLAAQLAEREKRGFSVVPGEAAPAAVAPVSTPRSVVFEQSEEERARKMAMLTGMKLMPQMPTKAEFYPDDEPNEEP